ncbi:MAG: diaminopropionate ammonia-lyase [Gammaproteobacteria bacterium]|nr:diaminopropionate ammonia-lyase [Gammaproteobacteria bacterium]
MITYQNTRTDLTAPRLFRVSAERPLAMLRQCPVYKPTPMSAVPSLAQTLGTGELYVKDESQRMNLGSFKALGGAYALAQMVCDKADNEDTMSERFKSVAREMTFITASAGNHGLSLAAGAKVFGSNAVIVLSTTVPEPFAERIRGIGADVVRVDGNYEDSVAHAIELADENDWLLLADGSWEGYIERPALVMEGYSVIAEEARIEFSASGDWPTHVFLQAGVGGLAASFAANIREHWDVQPTIIIVEPDAAPCLLQSVKSGKLTRGEGPESNMGRLDCKDASLITFEALRCDADLFVTVSDEQAQAATDLLGEHGFPSTPSGAATFAALTEMTLPKDSRCFMIVSEGPE